MASKGWFWRSNVAHYDFLVGETRFRGSLGIRKDSGVVNGKTPAERADEEVRLLRVQMEQKHTIEQVWQQNQNRMLAASQVNMAFDAVWDAWQARSMTNAGVDRRKLYASHLRTFCDWVCEKHPEIGVVSKLTSSIAREYLIHLRSLPGAAATKNDKLATLRMIFGTLGRECGLVENPFMSKDIRRVPMRQVNRQIYTPDQIRVLFAAPGWMYSLFVTAFSTFQREEDCCLIKKSNIFLDRNRVIFPMTEKTGVEISLPLMPRFRALAEDALASHPESEYLFPELAERYRKNPSSIGKTVKEYLAENGIGGAVIEVPGYARRVSVLDVHSIRHTAAVMAILAGWPLPMVMKATGHKTLKMVMRYLDHISDEDKDRYFVQLGRVMPEKTTTDSRKMLAELAYSLPLPTVERLLAELTLPQNPARQQLVSLPALP